MTLPNPGPGVSLSLSQIQTEFGGANPISLSEYYAGGAYVPGGTTGYYGAIPSSPSAISIRDFYGAPAGQVITITNGLYVSGLPSFFNFIGYSAFYGPIGSVSPGTLQGVTIRQIYQDTSPTNPTPDFYIQVAAVVAQTFWTTVTLTPGTTLTSSSATFNTSVSPAYSTWAFNNYNPGWVYPGTSTASFTF